MKIETVIEETLVAIYSEDIFNESLYLKGGQAMRFAEKSDLRLSTDIDFSIENKIEDPELFFKLLKECIYNHFDSINYHIFDFKFNRRPEIKKDNVPDFWGGWEVLFKLIENNKKTFSIDKKQREAIIPDGANGSTIQLEISQYEYCKSIQNIQIKGSIIKSYSRSLLVLEKLRALCQQHPAYQIKGNRLRARDFYDIAKLVEKYTSKGERLSLINECKDHLAGVFEAKAVSLSILNKITKGPFLSRQEVNWEQVKGTVSGKKEKFSFYVQVVDDFIKQIL